MTDVAAVYDDNAQINRAMDALLQAGVRKEEISLIISDKARSQFESQGETAGDRAVKGAGVGAAAGGILGALIVGLTTVGSIIIPGTTLLVAGPLIAALSGTGVGAAVGGSIGGLAGALSKGGISETEAKRYENEIKSGKALVIVHADDEAKVPAIRAALQTPKTGMTQAA